MKETNLGSEKLGINVEQHAFKLICPEHWNWRNGRFDGSHM
jgi:hypothetical protein